MVQTLIVIALVLVAAVYLGRMAWRALRPAKPGDGCGTGCGCAPAATPAKKQRPTAR